MLHREHRTKESAKERMKAARDQAMRSGLKIQMNTLPTAKQPYVWGHKDDSTDDEEVELKRLIETRTCIIEAIRRSKLTYTQQQETRDRENIGNIRNKEGNATPDPLQDKLDSKDSEPSQKTRNVRQRVSKEQDRVRKMTVVNTSSRSSDRSEREQDTDSSSATPKPNYEQDNLSVGSPC
jgi:hypothetical protein